MPRLNFDRVARPYQWLEYLLLGRALHRCRLHFVPQLPDRQKALVLGDGDGRFLAHLLARYPWLHANAVDLSPAMLRLLRGRATAASPTAATRLTTHQADARTFEPAGPYDLVVTHFFLDCLSEPELERLVARTAPHLAPGAIWLLSDFRIPPSGLPRLLALALVRSLYLAFRILTGLRVTRLPDHASALRRNGLTLDAQHRSLYGILTTEIWQTPPRTSLHPIAITAPPATP